MDLIKMTRELGAAIQKDERYLAFAEAKKISESDDELNTTIAKLQAIQTSFAQEQQKDIPDETLLQNFNDEFEKTYAILSSNENMQKYESARGEIDTMMNEIMQILGLCVNGADPETCQPSQEHDHDGCSGHCSGCSGC